MTDMLGIVSPILLLVLFGYLLQRRQYFEEISYQRVQKMIVGIAIPCMLFTTFLNMDLDLENLWASLAFAAVVILMLLVGFLLKWLLKIKYRFFPFSVTVFGFGTVGLAVYTLVFGVENAQYISILGVGHEFFIALIYIPMLHMFLGGQKLTPSLVLRNLRSPTLIMVVLGFTLRATGLHLLLLDNFLGASLATAIASLGSLTLPLVLIMVGYRIQFSNRAVLHTSAFYAALRFAVTIGVGFLFKQLVIDNIASVDPLFGHAYYILLFQHGALVLTALVGTYCPREDQEVLNTMFVLNFIGGFVFFAGYLLLFVK